MSSDRSPGWEWNEARDAHDTSRATREYLATLDDAAFGVASEVMPKRTEERFEINAEGGAAHSLFRSSTVQS
jgi:hypothetical protein